jgi:protein-S-isoprenylcysteine O-methyltransferase Ste14
MGYSLIKDPELLMKRGKYTTDDPETTFIPDKLFMALALPIFGFTIIFPGIDYAQNISQLPWYIEVIGFLGIIFGFIGMTYINMINRYASKGLVIHKDHELIKNGPYQYVRHPMYITISIFCVCIPLALGSFIAFVESFLFPLLLVYRIKIEEKMLMDHLPGYKEYMEQVKYRLIPKVY